MDVKFRNATPSLFNQSEPYKLKRRVFSQFKLWAFQTRYREIKKHREGLSELHAMAEAVAYTKDKGSTFDAAYEAEFDSFCQWMAYRKRRFRDCTLIDRLCTLDAEAGLNVKTYIMRMEHGK